MITAEGRVHDGLTALACKRGVTVVDITSSRMLMAHGFLRRLFEVFERFKTPVTWPTSEVSVSVTVDNSKRLDDIVHNLRSFAEVNLEPNMAIVCIGRESPRGTMFFAARWCRSRRFRCGWCRRRRRVATSPSSCATATWRRR
jgi:aspartate kinase